MLGDIAILAVSLGIILIGAGLFTNGIEWVGKKLNLAQGAVGSVLAAVGTALPETIIPLIAILFGTGAAAQDIGIGAILGAPFMLATLAIALSGGAVLLFKQRRAENYPRLEPDVAVFKRDISFFLLAYTLAAGASFAPTVLKHVIIVFLLAAYAYYVYRTFTAESGSAAGDDAGAEEVLEALYLARRYIEPPMARVWLQVFLAFVAIIAGAKIFVDAIGDLSAALGIPPLIIALLIAPVATELPEKFNSIIWLSQRKDTLALGNITGAMVFQSSVIPAIGIALTPWQLEPAALLSVSLALISALVLYLFVLFRNYLDARLLVVLGGVFYTLFVVIVLTLQ